MRKKFTEEERQNIWKKYRRRCAYCGCLLELKDMQVDHIIPYTRKSDIDMGRSYDNNWKKIHYGVDDFENLNPACRICNKWKGVWSVKEFKHEIQMQVSRLNKNSAGYRLALKYDLIKTTGANVTFYFEVLEIIG